MNTLKINGTTLTGIYVDAAVSFNKPAKRVSEYSIPGRNGNLVIDEGTFDNVLITYPVYEKNTFPTEFDNLVNWLASLEGYQRIECSNDPTHYRLGRFVVPEAPTAKRLNKDGYYTLTFDCKPQRWLLSGEEDTEIDANPIDEYSGAIVSFNAVALDEITELKANIEPIQSLNGQSSPYPAGGGKNVLPLTIAKLKTLNTAGTWSGDTYTRNGVTFTFDVAGGCVTAIKTANSASATTEFFLNNSDTSFLTTNTSYIISGCPSGGGGSKYKMDINPQGGYATDLGSGATFTAVPNSGHYAVRIVIYSGYGNGLAFHPMIRLASVSDPTYAPYSNICPISGHTEVNVVRTGKNLFDISSRVQNQTNASGTASSGYTLTGSTLIISKDASYYGRIMLSAMRLKRGSYNLSFDSSISGSGNVAYSIRKMDTPRSDIKALTIIAAGHISVPFSVSEDCDVAISIQPQNSTTGTVSITNLQLEVGSATAYEPYAGQTYPFTLGQTVYGGTLNVTTGVLTVDRAAVTLTDASQITGFSPSADYGAYGQLASDAKINNSSIMCISNMVQGISFDNRVGASYKVKDRCYVDNSGNVTLRASNQRSISTVADLFAVFDGCMIVYELATPTTVQLTAAEVSTLLGANNIWADTGDVEVKVTTPTVFNNPSLFNSKPLIRVYGIGTFRVNDITVTITAHDKPYIDIDCELQECYYDTENMSAYVSFSGNDFPELEPGNNYMLLASGITKLIVTPRWWIL